MDYFLVTIGYKDLYGDRLSLDAAKFRIQQYPLRQVRGVLGLMDELTSLEDIESRQSGHRFLINFLPTENQKSAIRSYVEKHTAKHENPPLILFHELQILNAVKLALIACADTNAPYVNDMGPLIEAMLIINDHLTIQAAIPPEFDNLEIQRRRELLIRYFIPNAVFHQGTGILNLLTRWYDLFFMDAPSLNDTPDYIDLRQALTKVTQVPVDLFYSLTLAFLMHWMRPQERVLKDGPSPIKPSRWLKDFDITPEEYQSVTQQIATTQGALSDEFTQRSDWEPYYFLPIQKAPLLIAGD